MTGGHRHFPATAPSEGRFLCLSLHTSYRYKPKMEQRGQFLPLTLDVKHRFLTTYSTRARGWCCLYFLVQMNNVDVNRQYFKHLHEVEHLHKGGCSIAVCFASKNMVLVHRTIDSAMIQENLPIIVAI
ncbi:hypothetical protein VPH35_071506 [Triticum aestivum]